jgi:chemotaxis protein histidine kinase CheA
LGEPYYSTKGSKGTGLGMMVAYGIIQSMKGSIVVHSEIGKGSCFQIKFPTHVSIMKKNLSINNVNSITETDQPASKKKKWYRTKADNNDPIKELSGEKTMK